MLHIITFIVGAWFGIGIMAFMNMAKDDNKK